MRHLVELLSVRRTVGAGQRWRHRTVDGSEPPDEEELGEAQVALHGGALRTRRDRLATGEGKAPAQGHQSLRFFRKASKENLFLHLFVVRKMTSSAVMAREASRPLEKLSLKAKTCGTKLKGQSKLRGCRETKPSGVDTSQDRAQGTVATTKLFRPCTRTIKLVSSKHCS